VETPLGGKITKKVQKETDTAKTKDEGDH